MSRRRPKWTRPEQVSVDLMCGCGQRLDRATLHGEDEQALTGQVTFFYDDADRPGRAWVMSRVKGRPATDNGEAVRAAGRRIDAELVRASLCTSCGARPELSERLLVEHLTAAWHAGKRGQLARVVIT